jgi:LPXTG-motif cell wall-anchored protein
MNRRNVSRKLSIAVASLVLAMSAVAPGLAVSGSDYGVWSEPVLNSESGSYSGTISFAGTTIPSATYETVFSDVGSQYNEVEIRDTSEEWISAGTPFGALFGSNGSSTTNNFLRTGVSVTSDLASATTTITFESPVPADSLGVVIADLDLDSATISAKSADDSALTGDEIVGSANPIGFNMCDTDKNIPTICEDVDDPKDLPLVTKNANDVYLVNSEVGEEVGVSAWVRPSAEISTLTIAHIGLGSPSTLRIVLAGPTIPMLADTGTKSNLFAIAFALMMLGALGIVYARRIARN